MSIPYCIKCNRNSNKEVAVTQKIWRKFTECFVIQGIKPEGELRQETQALLLLPLPQQ